MSKIPDPSPSLNRLRAAAALIPLIESGLADKKINADRAVLMAEFCAWAAGQNAEGAGPDGENLAGQINDGLEKLRSLLAVD